MATYRKKRSSLILGDIVLAVLVVTALLLVASF